MFQERYTKKRSWVLCIDFGTLSGINASGVRRTLVMSCSSVMYIWEVNLYQMKRTDACLTLKRLSTGQMPLIRKTKLLSCNTLYTQIILMFIVYF